MQTSEYTDRVGKRLAKKVSRHPVYQQMRKRALVAETRVADLKKKLAKRIDLHDADGKMLMKALAELNRLKSGVPSEETG